MRLTLTFIFFTVKLDHAQFLQTNRAYLEFASPEAQRDAQKNSMKRVSISAFPISYNPGSNFKAANWNSGKDVLLRGLSNYKEQTVRAYVRLLGFEQLLDKPEYFRTVRSFVPNSFLLNPPSYH